jgi:hypothetical protein
MIDKRIFSIPAILIISLFCILSVSCKQRSLNGMLIVTQVPGKMQNINSVTGEFWRYIPGARIVAVNPDKPSTPINLSEDFYSACSPEISVDGQHMLFTAQQNKNESWQIWDMDLLKLSSRKITSDIDNCTDAVFLPNGRVLYTKYTADSILKSSYSLFVCNADGSNPEQITFHPNANFATSVLKDGRLLTITRQLSPQQSDQMLMVIRPDGTKADIFYKGISGSELLSRSTETPDHKILFIESDSANPGKGEVISISYNRPLHSRISLTDGIAGNFNYVTPLKSGKLLVSYRPTDNESYALYEFDPVNKVIGKKVYGESGFNTIDAVPVEEVVRPKKLPSEVDMGVKTGLLLCQDINFQSLPLTGKRQSIPKASKIEVLGIDTTYGIVQVEGDGSFYLKVMADKPFQIRTLDEKDQTVNGPSAWMWLRPNERRGCIGCHEDHELAPENNVPLSVRKYPVIIPVHITEVTEKEVELE